MLKNKFKTLFFGTSEFAAVNLENLYQEFEVIGVICPPDRPSGRGKHISMCPVKNLALKLNLPVYQSEKISRDLELINYLKSLNPDIIAMVAYGQILKQNVLDLAPYGVINVHGSLLPNYRGAAPINWPIINGDTITGISTMQTELGLDSGPVFLQESIELDNDIQAPELSSKLAKIGGKLLVETLKLINENKIKPYPQDESKVTYAPLLNKEMAKLDLNKSSCQIHNLVRGLKPWPGSYITFNNQRIKILKTNLVKLPIRFNFTFKQIFNEGNKIYLGLNNNELIELVEVSPENRKPMEALAWYNGLHKEIKIADI